DSMVAVVLAKVLAYFFCHLALYVMTLPFILLFINLDVAMALTLGASFLAVTALILAFAHSLTISERGRPILQGLIALPLLVPVVILATMSVGRSEYLWLLLALVLILGPIFIAASSLALKK